jgi:hypothetical protein
VLRARIASRAASAFCRFRPLPLARPSVTLHSPPPFSPPSPLPLRSSAARSAAAAPAPPCVSGGFHSAKRRGPCGEPSVSTTVTSSTPRRSRTWRAGSADVADVTTNAGDEPYLNAYDYR